MSSIPVWPPPFPFPPSSSENWNATTKHYLAELIQWRLAASQNSQSFSERDIILLTEKLATQKAVRRFHHVNDFMRKTGMEDISYIDWLDRVLSGYQVFSEMLSLRTESEDGDQYIILRTIHQIINSVYLKQFHQRPTPDLREELAANLFLALSENYFFDTSLEPWLWRTARNIVLSHGRNPNNLHILAETEPNLDVWSYQKNSSGEDWLASQVQREALLEAIRQIPHRRYRVVLLLIYLFDLNNTELAAFFGATIPQVTTWRSRSLRALRKQFLKGKKF